MVIDKAVRNHYSNGYSEMLISKVVRVKDFQPVSLHNSSSYSYSDSYIISNTSSKCAIDLAILYRQCLPLATYQAETPVCSMHHLSATTG